MAPKASPRSERISPCVATCTRERTRRELTAVPGVGVVAALSKDDYGDDNNLLSKQEFGDCEVYLEFMLSKGSNSGVKLQQRYEIQFYDSYGKDETLGHRLRWRLPSLGVSP